MEVGARLWGASNARWRGSPRCLEERQLLQNLRLKSSLVPRRRGGPPVTEHGGGVLA